MSAEGTSVGVGVGVETTPLADPRPAVRGLAAGTKRERGHLRRNLRRVLIGNRLNLIGVVIVGAFLILSLIGELVAPYDPYRPAPAAELATTALQGPSGTHLLGTDEIGRDVFSRIIAGTRESLKVAVVVLVFAVVVGTTVGAVSGYRGGLVDELLMRLTDLFLAFPALVLAVAVAATLGRSLENTMIALSTVFWPWYARLVRAQVLSIKEREFVTAGRSIGMGSGRLLLRHILPNAVSVVIIQVTLDVGYAIAATSSLSFIGLGAQIPSAEWGKMLSDSRTYFPDSWWLFVFPGVALTLTIFAFNVLGDGLQDALDPRSGRR